MPKPWITDMNQNIADAMQSGTESRFDDWHSVITIKFGELIESGFDWGKDEYYTDDTNFTSEMRTRLNKKIEDHYYWREICCVPPGQFKHYLLRHLNEVMPKYMKLYMADAAGDLKVLRDETYNGKSRDVYSEYPQSQLKGSADYATNATDNANGHTRDGSPIEKAVYYRDNYDDIDVMVINELEVCFLSMTSLNVNAGV